MANQLRENQKSSQLTAQAKDQKIDFLNLGLWNARIER
jgi:hypothetical protein